MAIYESIGQIFSLLKQHTGIFITLAVILFLIAAMEVCVRIIRKLGTKGVNKTSNITFQKKIATYNNIAVSATRAVFAVLIGLFTATRLGIDLKPYLAAAGLASVAIGFGAKRFFEDLITGLIIFFDQQIRVGDVVQIAGVTGTVEAVTLKTVKLRDLKGHVYYVRNSSIDTVINMTKDFAYCLFDVGVSYNSDINKVFEAINEAFERLLETPLKSHLPEKIEILGLDKFDDSALVIRFRIKVSLTSMQWAIQRAFNKILKETFDERGIEIPFPQRDLHIKTKL